MSTRADVTGAANLGFKSKQGYSYFHCAEMIFGSSIRARESDPTLPDTSVSWTMRGDPAGLWIMTSIDGGGTWQRVFKSGDPIPKGDGKGGQVPMPIGTRTTNLSVLVRQIFVDATSTPVLDSITVTAAMKSGEIRTRTETGDDLKLGSLIGVHVGSSDGLQAQPEVFLDFFGDRGGLVYTPLAAHDADGKPLGLHVSHGDTTYGGPQGESRIEAQKDDANRYAAASFAGELWISPSQATGTILGWSSLQGTSGKERLGFRLALRESGDAAELVLQVVELVALLLQAPASSPGNWQVRSNVFELYSGEATIPLNRWTHVAWSYDGFWMNLLVNGILVARRALIAQFNRATITTKVNGKDKKTRVPIGIVVPTDGNFVVGRHPVPEQNQGAGGLAESFKGLMSELRIYDRPLTNGQIWKRLRRRVDNAIDTAALVENEGLVALYPMNASTGTTALDVTGHSLHLRFNQQQMATTRKPPQLGWRAGVAQIWRGYPINAMGQDPTDYARGRTSPPLDLDVPGDVLRLTNRPTDVTFPSAAPYSSKLFRGVGNSGTLEMIVEPADLIPTGIAMQLSGIATQHVSLAARADYMDRPCRVWLVLFDEDDELVLDPVLVFEGRMDTLDVSLSDTATCTLTAESHLRRWSAPGHQRWNDQAQRAKYLDDYGLEFLAEMVDKEVWWPAKLSDSNSTPTQ